MNSTKPTHEIELSGGRILAAQEYGNPTGPPVLFLGAAPGSRAFNPNPEATAESGVRLIVTDRPGYGGSTPYAADQTPSWAQVANDHAELITHLGLRDVKIVGWSNGGIGALALAASYPDLLEKVSLMGTPAPDEEVPWVPEEFKGFLVSLRADPASAVHALMPALSPLVEAPEGGLASIALGPVDETVLLDEIVKSRLLRMLEVGLATSAGIAADIVATNVAPLGFDLADVKVPVTLFYGDADLRVPGAHGEYYSSRLQDSELVILEAAGHLGVVAEWKRIIS